MATQMMWPPGFFGSGSGVGEDGVVAVAGVDRVDGDEVELAQVGALAQGGGDLGVGLGDHLVGEGVGDAVLVDGDERDGAGAVRVAEASEDAGRGQAQAGAAAHGLGLDQLAVAGAALSVAGDAPFLVLLLVDRQDAPALGGEAEDAEHAPRVDAKPADQPGLMRMLLPFDRGEPGKDAVAGAERGIALFRDDEDLCLAGASTPDSSGWAKRSPCASGLMPRTATGGSAPGAA